jgi:EAL domain-containing protein (putative c-di-GMP-specific phosphodiesterase class I)
MKLPFRLSSAASAQPSASGPFARADAIDDAINRGEFHLIYQPKLNLRTKRVDGVEALMRWHHPHDGIRMPDNFIAESEASGAIDRLSLWAFDRAMADQRWLAENHGFDLLFHVNLSAQLLNRKAMVIDLCRRARTTDGRIGIEITERSMIDDPEQAFAHIEMLRTAGYRIAIDDYGVGLSSLTYLKQLDADELKIDKSFITALDTSHRDPLIVRSTIDLAHALGMTVTAEGVESPAAFALLSVMGCDAVQGYLVSRPLPLADLPVFLTGFDVATISFPKDDSVLRNAAFWKRA